jgi:pilus assembly protein CpaE
MASERVLRGGLTELVSGRLDLRRGGIRAAIAAMQTEVTPGVLVVDISGEDQPLSALAQLANVVEPDVCVLVIGEVDSVDFYREVTRSLGAQDYLPKPLTSDKVSRHVGAMLGGEAQADGALGGGLVVITGVRGGVGATTLAVNLAGYFGISMHRHTVLLDPDLYLGDAAFLCNVKPGPGLRMALEMPERIDALLAERAAQPAAERFHVLAGEEPLGSPLNYAVDGASKLLGALRRRYNFIVADLPFRPGQIYDAVLAEPHQRVLVMLPTLTSVRATLRLLQTSGRTGRAKRPVIVLNRCGIPNGLTRRQVEDALAVKVDVAVPDEPRQLMAAASMGELVVTGRGGVRAGILELARNVASVGMLDTSVAAGPVEVDASGGLLRRIFRRKP